ncbi:MAG TPA: hypothetical protein VL357_06045 [Rariglobus sp.]|nr:hypothetical protein [Rariglobus sp.]
MKRPLCQAFALYAAIDARYGGDAKGPSYVDQDIVASIRAAGAQTA